MTPRATILIATRNRYEQLLISLPALRARAYRDVEIIVVDDGSIDGTLELLEDYRDLLTVHRTGRTGPWAKNASHVWNLGHRLASSPVVIEQGGEVVHLTDCVTPLVEACEPGRVAFARVFHGEPFQLNAIQRDIARKGPEIVPDVEAFKVRTNWDIGPAPRVGRQRVALYTGAERLAPLLFLGAIHQSDFAAAQGYDETPGPGGFNNDGEFADRLQANGVRFFFSGRALAFHQKHRKV